MAVPAIASRQRICGLLGVVRLLSGPYLVIITRKVRVGEINRCAIWRVEHTEIVPFSRTTTHLSEAQVGTARRRAAGRCYGTDSDGGRSCLVWWQMFVGNA